MLWTTSAGTAAAADVALVAKPYRVLGCVAFENDASIASAFRGHSINELQRTIDRAFGRMWTVRVVENDWLFPASLVGLDRVTAADLTARFGTANYDKVLLVTLEVSGARYDVSGLEWDAKTRTISPPATAQTFERREVEGTIARLAGKLFRPVLAVERVDTKEVVSRIVSLSGSSLRGRLVEHVDDEVVLRVQAGRYPAPDPDVAQIRPGDLIQPFFRYLDQERVVKRVQSLPWTYLVVKSIDRGRVRCALITGLRNPLRGSRRRLVEVAALRVRPRFSSTRLKVVPRNNPARPLIGYTVRAVTKLRSNDKSESEPLRLISNRQGLVDIPAAKGAPLLWLYVESGDALLARVPFVPGLHPSGVIELPDDSIRLTVEGRTDLLLNRLIDTVAQRAVLITRARTLAREGDWKNVDRQLAELNKLTGIKQYEDELTLIRVPGIEAARRTNDRLAEANVNRICTRVSQLIRRYLAEDSVRTLKTDLKALRKLDEEDRRSLGAK